MEVVINGNPQTLDVSDCANLAELVALAGEQLESADRDYAGSTSNMQVAPPPPPPPPPHPRP